IAFLKRLIESKAFSSADLDTGLIERNQSDLFPEVIPASLATLALASISLLQSEKTAGDNPWQSSQGWRMNSQLQRQLQLDEETHAHAVQVTYQTGGWLVRAGDAVAQVKLVSTNVSDLVLSIGEQTVQGTVVRDGEYLHVFSQGVHTALHYKDALAHAGEAEAEGGRLTAPMPGKIVAVLVSKEQEVKKGDALLIMEAMKMEHTIAAPHDGIVEEVLYALGDQVTEGAPLLTFKQE
ncbi:MAG: biotin/lipoyl-containing protein, partial [Undibacterium sp.]|nr:biotin/lipoyl-containing protein [Undibacterium sp.]